MADITQSKTDSPQPTGRCRLTAALVLGTLFSGPAHAYVDPGTGSVLLQALLGAVAAVMVAGSLWWQRVKSFFSSIFGSRKGDDAETPLDKE